jgi:hypothetical protein
MAGGEKRNRIVSNILYYYDNENEVVLDKVWGQEIVDVPLGQLVTIVPMSLQAALAEYRLFPHAPLMQDNDADHWAHMEGTDRRRTCNGQMDRQTDRRMTDRRVDHRDGMQLPYSLEQHSLDS